MNRGGHLRRLVVLSLALSIAGCGGGGDGHGDSGPSGPSAQDFVIESEQLVEGAAIPGACGVRVRVRNLRSTGRSVTLEYTAFNGSGQGIAFATPTIIMPANGVGTNTATGGTFITGNRGTIRCSSIASFRLTRVFGAS